METSCRGNDSGPIRPPLGLPERGKAKMPSVEGRSKDIAWNASHGRNTQGFASRSGGARRACIGRQGRRCKKEELMQKPNSRLAGQEGRDWGIKLPISIKFGRGRNALRKEVVEALDLDQWSTLERIYERFLQRRPGGLSGPSSWGSGKSLKRPRAGR